MRPSLASACVWWVPGLAASFMAEPQPPHDPLLFIELGPGVTVKTQVEGYEEERLTEQLDAAMAAPLGEPSYAPPFVRVGTLPKAHNWDGKPLEKLMAQERTDALGAWERSLR